MTPDIDNSDLAKPIHVMIADFPNQLAQAIEVAVRQQSDMRYLGAIDANVTTQTGNLRFFQSIQSDVDVLILSAPQLFPLPGIFTHLLAEYKDLRILLVSETEEAACAYWMGINWKRLSSVSVASLITNIRFVANLNPMHEDKTDAT